jgi:hypothetical protein
MQLLDVDRVRIHRNICDAQRAAKKHQRRSQRDRRWRHRQ